MENKNSKKLAKKINTRKVITYGINKIEADLNILKIIKKNNKSIFSIKLKKDKFHKNKGYL